MNSNYHLKELSTREDFVKIILGGAFLGSGGGGPINIAEKIMLAILDSGVKIKVLQANAISKNDTGAVVAFMGSPEVGSEGVDFDSAVRAFDILNDAISDKKFNFVLPIELGAGNSMVPLYVASKKGIPVIDCDGAGRAVPKLENTLYAANNISVSPSTLTNSALNNKPNVETVIKFTKEDATKFNLPVELENLTREMVEKNDYFTGVGGLSTYSISGDKVLSSSVNYSLSLIYMLGGGIMNAFMLMPPADPINYLIPVLRALRMRFYIYKGKVTNIIKPGENKSKNNDGPGFDYGKVEILGDDKSNFEITFENENLFATKNGKPWAMGPDLICYLSPDGPLSNVEIEKDMEIYIFGIPANESFRANKKIVDSFMQILKDLNVYEGPYINIENLDK